MYASCNCLCLPASIVSPGSMKPANRLYLPLGQEDLRPSKHLSLFDDTTMVMIHGSVRGQWSVPQLCNAFSKSNVNKIKCAYCYFLSSLHFLTQPPSAAIVAEPQEEQYPLFLCQWRSDRACKHGFNEYVYVNYLDHLLGGSNLRHNPSFPWGQVGHNCSWFLKACSNLQDDANIKTLSHAP